MKTYLTIVENSNGNLTKQITKCVDKINKTSQAILSQGICIRQTTTLKELSELLKQIKPNQALILGVPPTDRPYHIVSQVDYSKLSSQEKLNTITRTKKFFSYPKTNALCMFDIDLIDEGPDINSILKSLLELLPPNTGYVFNPSSSSYIYDEDTLVTNESYHVYFMVKESSDIKRFKDVLLKRSWLINNGYIFNSISGSQEARSYLFDQAVFSPERLDFVAPAIITPPLQSRKPDPLYQEGEVLDTKLLKNLSGKEEAEYLKLVKEAKRLNKPIAEQLMNQHEYKRTKDFVEKHKELGDDFSYKRVREHMRDKINGRLDSLDVLCFDKFGSVTIGDVYKDPKKYKNQTLADPLEPEAGKGKAKLYVNSNSIIVKSFLHGGKIYQCYPSSASEFLDKIPIRVDYDYNNSYKITRDLDIASHYSHSRVFRIGDVPIYITGREGFLVSHILKESVAIDEINQFAFCTDKEGIKSRPLSPARIRSWIDNNHNRKRELRGLVNHPYVNEKGDIITDSGYNKETKIFAYIDDTCREWCVDPIIYNDPKMLHERAKGAYNNIVKEAFKDFPFKDKLSEACAVSALLSAVERKVLDICPGYLFSAPVPRTGKTALAELIHTIVHGTRPNPTTFSVEKAELRKQVLSILLGGESSVLFDNVGDGRTIDSEDIAAAMTSGQYQGRVLGISSMVKVPTKVLWMFTGNNISLSSDFESRIMEVRLDANTSDLNKIKRSRHNLYEWAIENRGQILSNITTLILNNNAHILSYHNNYSRFGYLWDWFVRFPILNTVGIDIVEAFERNEEASADKSSLGVFFTTWRSQYPNPLTSQEFLIACGNQGIASPLGELFLSVFPSEKIKFGDKFPNVKALTAWFNTKVDLIHNNLKLTKGTLNKGSNPKTLVWSLIIIKQ